jgi:hypothetical protein
VTAVRQANIPDPFLGKSSVNTLPLLGSRFLIMQKLHYNSEKSCVIYVVRAERLLARRGLELSQLRISSVRDLSMETEE